MRYGVTFARDGVKDGPRDRELDSVTGEPAVYETRQRALTEAGGYTDKWEARVVKLKPVKKGWRPASEPPEGGRPVMVWCRHTLIAWKEGGDWYDREGRLYSVTHWRPLPKGPKNG